MQKGVVQFWIGFLWYGSMIEYIPNQEYIDNSMKVYFMFFVFH